MNNNQLAATTGFLDKIDIENETVWLGGWFLSFESAAVDKLKVYLGKLELTDFEITKNLPSPGVKKVHPNIPAAERCRFLIQLSMTTAQQQQFRDSLISIIPTIENRDGEPLLSAVNPCLSPLLKQEKSLEIDGDENVESTPKVELIYVHVPKAAGTAFRKILQQVYGPQGVLTDTTNMFEDNMPPTIDRQTKVIDGHFRAGKYDKLFPNTQTITWLRQPIHRLISDYCFRQIGSLKQKEFISKERLLEFAKIPGNRNLMSYCINGKPLNYFHFIGIQEYFEEDLQDLQQLLGWQEVTAVYQNRNPYPEYNQFKQEVFADKKLIEELTALNSQDLQLYQSAWKLRDQRKKGLITLPLTPPPKTQKQPVIQKPKENTSREPVVTIGSIDKVVVSESPAGKGGENSDRPLQVAIQIAGWVFSPKLGLADGFKLSVGSLKVGKLQPQIGLPSADVKKIHPNSPSAGKARFRLQASLAPEQIEQLATKGTATDLQLSLTPIFQGHPGKEIVKALSPEQASNLLAQAVKPQLKPKRTVGYLDRAEIKGREAIASGWLASAGGGPLTGLKVSIGGIVLNKFEQTLNIPSPDVGKKHPNLDNSDAARFELRIALEPTQVEEFKDSLLLLTPIFQAGKGTVMTKVLTLSLAGGTGETPVLPDEVAAGTGESPVLPDEVAGGEPDEVAAGTGESPVLPDEVAGGEPDGLAVGTGETPVLPDEVAGGEQAQEKLSPPIPHSPQLKRSPLLDKIKAQIERSRTEIQEIKADLEGGTLPTRIEKENPEKKNLTEKLAAGKGKTLSLGERNPVPHDTKGDISPPASGEEWGGNFPLLGLSGVSIEKFWSLVDPVIGKQRPTTNPPISILTPTWNSSLDWFVETVLSVLGQTNPDWEWCLVDDGSQNQDIKTVLAGLAAKDPRIKVRFAESSGISGATNKALEMATGDYICCLDHDDTLAPTALADSLDKLAEGYDVSYSDEDKIDLSGLNYIQPFLKPDWSPEYFRGVMYVGHLLCVRRDLALRVGGFKSEFDGVQDYEFMLRVSELTAKIAHIPKHLYHWRQVRGSISADADAKAGIETVQQAAVNAHLQRLGLPAKAEPGLGRHRVNINPLPRTENPLVSLIVSSQNPEDRLQGWLNDLLSKTAYPNLEIIVALTYEKTEQLPATIHNFPVKTVRAKDKSNFSRANNFATQKAEGEYLVFINPGVRSITEDWLRHLLYYAEQSDVGAVGGLLVFPDGTVEHAGIILGNQKEEIEDDSQFPIPNSQFPDFVMRGFKTDADGYAGSLVCAREVVAISKDCLMVKKSIFAGVGSFNQHLLTGYQETDLCLKIRRENKRIIFTPRSVLLNPHSTNLQLDNIDFLDKMLLLDSHHN